MPTSSRARMTRVAIVDAYSTGRFLPPVLHRYGVECVHVHSQNPDIRLKFNEDGFVDHLLHDGDLVAMASTLRAYEVSHVIAGTESGVILADQLLSRALLCRV